MPYARAASLPPSVRRALPPRALSMFRKVVNRALVTYRGDEAKAFATAWMAVKRKYRKDRRTGRWVKRGRR